LGGKLKRGEEKMCFRYDDIGRVYTEEEQDRQKFIDTAIMDLLNKVNPTDDFIYSNKRIIDKVRDTLIDIFTKDLNLCTERKFYP